MDFYKEIKDSNINSSIDSSIFKSMFYDNSLPMLLVNPENSSIIDINKSAKDFYGYTKKELIGKPLYETINPFINKEVMAEHAREASRAKHKIFEGFKHRLKDGTLRDVQVSLTVLYMFGKNLILSIVVDVTEKIWQENQLIKLNGDLENSKLLYSILVSINEIEKQTDVSYLKEVAKVANKKDMFNSIWIGRYLKGNLKPVAYSGANGKNLIEYYRSPRWKEKSLTMNAIISRKFTYTANYLTDKRVDHEVGNIYNIVTAGVIPIIRNDSVWGIIAITSDKRNLFSKTAIEISKRISFIVNNRLHEIDLKTSEKKARDELRRKKNEVESIGRHYRALAEANELMMREKDRDKIYSGICKIILKNIKDYAFVWVGLYNGFRIEPVGFYSNFDKAYDWFIDLLGNNPFTRTQDYPSVVMDSFYDSKTIVLNDYKSDKRYSSTPWLGFLELLGSNSVASLPLRLKDRTVGSITVYGKTNSFNKNVIRLLDALAENLSNKLYLLQLEEKEEENKKIIEHMAYHDSLTGIPNRAYFQNRLKQLISRSKRIGEPVCILILDLDGFKPVNDTLGHDYGDRVLKEIGERIKKTVRAEDTAARIGGDEFAVILDPFSSSEDVIGLSKRIIKEINIPIQINKKTARVGVSIGIGIDYRAVDDIETIQKSADIALYEAKESGKNRFALKEIR